MHTSHLDEVQLPVLIAALDLEGLLPGQCSLNRLHAEAVRRHHVGMHQGSGQCRLGHRLLAAALTTVLAEDDSLMQRNKGGGVGE